MTFFSILFALLIEQLRPLRADNALYAWVKSYATRIERLFNAGHKDHGRFAWFIVVASLTIPVALVYWLFASINPLLAFIWNVIVVYLTLGFRHYSHYYNSIQVALNSGDEVTARSLLGEWIKKDTAGMDVSEISRLAAERALITTHRNVFGVFFWFLLPLGPACAVMYRVSECLTHTWNDPDHLKNDDFGNFAKRAFFWIDWVPSRLTAIAFAVVGNFEDAIYAWRNFAHRWKDQTVGIILAAGGGAMGVRLGAPVEVVETVLPVDAATVHAVDDDEEEALPGDDPSPRVLQSTVGLVWRALLLWMILLLLLSAGKWAGALS
jgi:adenosylcobinamide-phosphate synthase